MQLRIQQMSAQLSPAERRVADWLLEHPFDVATIKLAALAQAIGVSEPTVVRFCRRIGCHGFSDFRLRWAASSSDRRERVHAVVRDRDSAATVIRKVFDTGIAELQRVVNGLDAERMQQVATKIAASQRVLFAGSGASAIVARDAENKFFRLGLACTAATDEPTILQAAATCGKQQVFVGISKSGQAEALAMAMRSAAKCGAFTVALTTPGSLVARTADATLPVDATEDTAIYTPMSSRLAQLTVLDALQVCTAISAGASARHHLEASKAALSARAF